MVICVPPICAGGRQGRATSDGSIIVAGKQGTASLPNETRVGVLGNSRQNESRTFILLANCNRAAEASVR